MTGYITLEHARHLIHLTSGLFIFYRDSQVPNAILEEAATHCHTPCVVTEDPQKQGVLCVYHGELEGAIEYTGPWAIWSIVRWMRQMSGEDL